MLLFVVALAHAASLTPTFGNSMTGPYSVYWGGSIRHTSFHGRCNSITDCVGLTGGPTDQEEIGENVCYGEGRLHVRATITPGSLFVSTSVEAWGAAECLLPVCESAPTFPVGPGYAYFGNSLHVDAPAAGIVVFNMQTDGQLPVRMIFPVSKGLQAVMPLSVFTMMDFYIDSPGLSDAFLEHSVRITDVPIVPEPMMASLVFGGLVLTAALAQVRRGRGAKS